MKILYINHEKSQCGIYEIGKRIHGLFDTSLLDAVYAETPVGGIVTYRDLVEEHKPDLIIYNYFTVTLPYVSRQLFNEYPNIKHVGIIHDPLYPEDIEFYNNTFDAWIIHDDNTNIIKSTNKFSTVRPILRFTKPERNNNVLSIGSHGFDVSPWKMFGESIDIIHENFDEVIINLNITNATFGNNNHDCRDWVNKITKKGVSLNITNTYFDTEIEVVDFLSKNDMNMYFYSPPHPFVGVGGSADLAISAQSSLCVNNTYMYEHIHKHLGYFEKSNNLSDFLRNEEEVKKLYDLWSPTRMTTDYLKMINSL